jgi:glutaredoxin-related protein
LRKFLVAALLSTVSVAALAAGEVEWFSAGPGGEDRIVLHYFYADTCPVCTEAKPFIEALREVAWLEVRAFEVSANRDNALRYRDTAAAIGGQARSVPAYIACGAMLTGYNGPEPTWERLSAIFKRCLPGAGAPSATED